MSKNINQELMDFESSEIGIISCVYIFGEGFDMPKLNGVCFAENMESEIRIVQCALRPCRLEKGNDSKIAHIIMPYLDNGDWNDDNNSFDKIRKIVKKIRNEDENVEQRMRVMLCNGKDKDKNDDKDMDNNDVFEMDEDISIYNSDELEKIKIRLRYSKTLDSNCSEEQDEYNYVRMLNKAMMLCSMEDYINSKEKHKNFIENADDYFKKKGVWCGWYDFLGVETSAFIQSLDAWKIFCKKQNIKSLEEYKNACKDKKELPKDPHNFYREFTNLLNELDVVKRRR